MEIIDFHTHPFLTPERTFCDYREAVSMTPEYTKHLMENLGVSKICGAVICGGRLENTWWEKIKANNDEALKLKELYGDFYVPGFHVHPDYVRESCEEIERMHKLGVNLIGELVPYLDGWREYKNKNFYEILDVARQYDMIINVDSMETDKLEAFVSDNEDLTIVAAHPGERGDFMRHMEVMAKHENYYLDLSGYGLFRHGMLRYGINLFGPHRFLFGSDYPTCSPAMYIGGVMLDPLITDDEKELIMYGNAKRLLKL